MMNQLRLKGLLKDVYFLNRNALASVRSIPTEIAGGCS